MPSNTPNSLVIGSPGVGEGSAVGAVTLRLMRRPTRVLCAEFTPNPGEPAADVRLEIRGIFVGVSLCKEDMEFSKTEGGPSLGSFDALYPVVPTEGEPAMVGSWFLLRREASDCFCIELTVWEVTREDDAVLVIEVAPVGVEIELLLALRLATRCAVVAGSAVICMGGKVTAVLVFFASVDDSVLADAVSASCP